MNDEEIKAIEKLKETAKQCHNSKECWENESCCDCYVEVEDIFAIETVLNLIEKQKADIEEYKAILDIGNNRKYRKKYLEERRKEEPNLLYPDADEIYERYYKQKEDIEDYEKILDIYDERKYRKQYLEEERAKRKNLLYPDSDEIYQRYFEQKEEIEKKDKIINDAIKWIENTMNDSRVTGCNLGDLQLLFDILKDKK